MTVWWAELTWAHSWDCGNSNMFVGDEEPDFNVAQSKEERKQKTMTNESTLTVTAEINIKSTLRI